MDGGSERGWDQGRGGMRGRWIDRKQRGTTNCFIKKELIIEFQHVQSYADPKIEV